MPDGEYGPLNVLKRNRLGSYVHFECPTCRQTVALGPASLTEIEAGMAS